MASVACERIRGMGGTTLTAADSPKTWVKNLSQCEDPQRLTNPGLCGERLANNRLRDGTTLDAMQSGIDSYQCFGATRCLRVQETEVQDYSLLGYTVHSCRMTPTLFTTFRRHLHT